MKTRTSALCLTALFAVNCGGNQKGRGAQSNAIKSSPLNESQAIAVAKNEAVREGERIEQYDINAVEETEAWRIEFGIKDITVRGGGWVYLIDKKTGAVVGRQAYQ